MFKCVNLFFNGCYEVKLDKNNYEFNCGYHETFTIKVKNGVRSTRDIEISALQLESCNQEEVKYKSFVKENGTHQLQSKKEILA